MQDILRNQVQEIRDNYGMTYAFMAKKTGISQSMIRLWLKGERNFSEAYLKIMKDFISKY